MPRRGNNIYKRADGRWEGRILKEEVLPGEARYKYVYGKTYSEVKKKMDIVKQNIKKSCSCCHITMEEAIGIWLADKQDYWKITTRAAYNNLTRKYIIPMIGSCRISQIDSQLIEKFIGSIRYNENGKSLSHGYLHNICSVILMVLNHMKKKYHFAIELPDNPVVLNHRGNKVILPGGHELKVLEEYLKEHMSSDGTSLGILTALYTGIRIGELCALRWENINLDDEVIYVRQSIQRMKNYKPERENTTVVFQAPKTITSVREIPIPPALLPYLKKYRGSNEDFLVKGKKKPFAEPRTVEYRFARILDKCSLKKFHFHMLRHAFATRCISMGFDVKSLSELLGHSNIQTTLRLYVHSSMQHKKKLMNLFCFSECEEMVSSF